LSAQIRDPRALDRDVVGHGLLERSAKLFPAGEPDLGRHRDETWSNFSTVIDEPSGYASRRSDRDRSGPLHDRDGDGIAYD
jgi:hypothetical protein